jgi:hypothetical protein
VLRHRHLEIARGTQLLEIFGEEPVVAIVRRRRLPATTISSSERVVLVVAFIEASMSMARLTRAAR